MSNPGEGQSLMVMRGVLRGIGGAVASARSRQAAATTASPLGVSDRLEMLDALEESGVAWFWASDSANHLTYLSASALAAVAPEGTEILGQPLVDLFETVAAGSDERSERPISFLLGTRNRFADLVVRSKGAAEGECHLALSGRPQFDDQGQFLGYRGSAKDVSDSFERQRDEQRLAQFDSLTGLSNR
ncbi:MAG: GGDEF domain-containing protein, partial [Croceibacterium sp.]